MRLLSRFLSTFLFFLLPISAFSAKISVRVKLQPTKIGLSESATFSVEVHNGQAGRITPPKVSGLHFQYNGTSSSSSINLINGKFSSVTINAQNFSVRAIKTGVYTIPSFSVTVKGKSYSTKPLTLTVVKQVQRRSRGGGSLFDQFFAAQPQVPSLYQRLYPQTESVYQNQALIVDNVVFSRNKDALNYQLVEVNPLRSDRALVYDISQSIDSNQIQKMQDQAGNLYYGKIYHRYVVFPIDKGEIALRSPRIVAVSPFGQLEVNGRNISFRSLKVGDLAGVTYIGKLSLKWGIYTNQVEKGKTIDLIIKMKGTGNLRVLSNPYGQLQIPGVFLSTPRSEIHFDTMRNGKAYFTQKVIYTLMARKEGVFRVPDLKVEGYDDQMKPFEKLLKGFEIKVLPSDNIQQQMKSIGKPIMVTKPKQWHYLLFHPVILLLIFFSLILPIFSKIVGLHLKRLEEDPDYARKIKAGQRLNHYLKKAHRYLEEGKLKDFYHELEIAVLHFLTDKLSLPVGIRLEKLKQVLDEKLPEDQVERIFDFIKMCERNSYGMTVNEGDAQSALNNANLILTEIRKRK